MREILFRGKRTDNGEWVEGYLTKSYFALPYRAIWCIEKEEVKAIYKQGTEYTMQPYEVIPSTVGEYTGLKDKNGKEIFEGDIVKTQPFYDKPYSDKRKSKQFMGVVIYKVHTFNGNNVYAKQDYHSEWGLKFNEDFGKFTHYSWGELWNCEIIGNIHDNKELLEVQK